MKNPIEEMNHSPNSDLGGAPEKEMSLEKRESLLENVDLSKVEDYKFSFPLLEYCTKLKMVLGDPENNIKDGIMAVMANFEPNDPKTKEDIESHEWNTGPALNKSNLDWEKIEKNGYISVSLKLGHYLIGTQTTDYEEVFGIKKSYKKFHPISDVPSLLGVDSLDMESLKGIETDVKEKEEEVIAKIKDKLSNEGLASKDTDLVLERYDAHILLELEKKIPEEIIKKREERPLKREQELEFNHDGHSFKVTGMRMDNENGEYDEEMDKDNPFFIKRGGAKTKCIVDGINMEHHHVHKKRDLHYILKWIYKDID